VLTLPSLADWVSFDGIPVPELSSMPDQKWRSSHSSFETDRAVTTEFDFSYKQNLYNDCGPGRHYDEMK
jgi:hypothetical protein